MHKPEYRLGSSRSRRTRLSPVAQAGSVSLEFVILLPLLIMILGGIADFSLMMYDKAALVTAARVAARAGTMVSAKADVAAVATANANGSLVSFGTSSAPSVTVSPSGAGSPGTPLTVQLSYTYHGLFLGSVFSALTGPVVLNATAVMNFE